MVNNVCQKTTAQCGTNMYIHNGVCKCLPHLLQYQNACYQCPANSVVTAGQTGCVCVQGYVLSSQHTCVLASTASGSSSSSSNLQSSSSTSTHSSSTHSSSSSSQSSQSSQSSSSGSVQSGSSSSSSTGNIYGGGATTISTHSTNTQTSTSTSTSSNIAKISANQSVLILNAVYVNIKATNLPSQLTNNNCLNCHNLIVASLANSPTNVKVHINFIPSTTHQWVAAVVFQQSHFNVTLQLRFNPTYSVFFNQQ